MASAGVALGPQGRLPKQEPAQACGLLFVPVDAAVEQAGAGWPVVFALGDCVPVTALQQRRSVLQHHHLNGGLIVFPFHFVLLLWVAFGSKSSKIFF